MHRGDWVFAVIVLVPTAIGFLVFAAYPLVRGVYLSFTEFHILTPATWNGLDNLRELLADSVFWHSLGVTLYFVVLAVTIGMFFSIVTAVIMHRLNASSLVRGLVLLPFLVSGVVAGTVWSWLLDPQLGLINIGVEHLIGHPVLFLNSSAWAMPSVALISVWKSMGYNAVIIFAGLQTIPKTVYEAGRIDGAGEVRMFWNLTLPLLRPIIAMVLVLTVIGSFQVFDIIQVTTEGGPANATNVLQNYIYSKAFGEFDFGYASTMSLALFAILLTITFLQTRMLRANESDTN